MRVLIVESKLELGRIWQNHLERQGVEVSLVANETEAVTGIRYFRPQMIVVNVRMDGINALAISDFAAYHLPKTKVIFVSRDSFFSDGSIFRHAVNACAFVPEKVRPDDLCAMVEHYGASA